jgi:hypothetical protein
MVSDHMTYISMRLLSNMYECMYGREGGTFKLLLEFTEDYPNKPPVCSRMILFGGCMYIHMYACTYFKSGIHDVYCARR